jgi:hypothetical protein
VLGNEKGGSGKSTVAMHIAVALLKAGQRVATIDLDSRQKSFTHYIENRKAWAKHARLDLELPTHYCVSRKDGALVADNEAGEFGEFAAAVDASEHTHDFIVIDTPGHDSYLMRLAHSMADTLITPLNDSFVDFDVLGTVDPVTFSAPAIFPTWCATHAGSAASSITPPSTGSSSAIASHCSARATSGWSARGCRSFRCGSASVPRTALLSA